ncbi:MAG TPA: GNAT family N-acetyltransferase [Bryobacteraceae bacterium]|jgi:GNAT superfamily N-acetyltransferase|nr:GNAT family N-acetyltransferase [Bryobacteraceae bacterium]
MAEIRRLTAEEGRPYLGDLAEVLLDCVKGGASVSFMASLSKSEAESFFEKVLGDVQRGDRILLAAFIDSRLVGTVQILLATPPNQPHRADVAKLLVRRSARGQGIGRQLMEQVEEASRLARKTLLVLDTVTGDPAERLYLRLGWNRVGVIPKYALYPDGTWCDTTIFWKQLL